MYTVAIINTVRVSSPAAQENVLINITLTFTFAEFILADDERRLLLK